MYKNSLFQKYQTEKGEVGIDLRPIDKAASVYLNKCGFFTRNRADNGRGHARVSRPSDHRGLAPSHPHLQHLKCHARSRNADLSTQSRSTSLSASKAYDVRKGRAEDPSLLLLVLPRAICRPGSGPLPAGRAIILRGLFLLPRLLLGGGRGRGGKGRGVGGEAAEGGGCRCGDTVAGREGGEEATSGRRAQHRAERERETFEEMTE